MIELSLSEYCLLIVCATFVLVGLFGWISSFAHRNAERRGRKVRFVCDLCLTAWEDHGKEKIVPCPHCGRDSERSG